MMEILKFLALLAGIFAGIDLLAALVYLFGWLFLRAVDYWGAWMDAHPEEGKQ